MNESTITERIARANAERDGWKQKYFNTVFERDALLKITWLDTPDEPDESSKFWQDKFTAGWERKAVSVELRAERATLLAALTEARDAAKKSQAAIHELTLTLANTSRRECEDTRREAYGKASTAGDANETLLTKLNAIVDDGRPNFAARVLAIAQRV